jgi:hypothetical protein
VGNDGRTVPQDGGEGVIAHANTTARDRIVEYEGGLSGIMWSVAPVSATRRDVQGHFRASRKEIE